MESNNKNLKITEMFGAKANGDWYRFFYGTIKREKDEDGNEYLVRGKIKVNENKHSGYVYSIAENQQQLSVNLDELVTMALDKEIHKPNGITSKIAQTSYFHN